MRAVALVGFNDKDVFTGPRCARGGFYNLGSDDIGRSQLCGEQDVDQHCRRCGLAVSTSNSDAAHQRTDRCKHFGSVKHQDSGARRRKNLDVVTRNSGGIRHCIDVSNNVHGMADRDIDSARPQGLHSRILANVRSGDCVSHFM